MTALLHVLSANSHVQKATKTNWYPWTDKPDRAVVGWRGEPWDGGNPTYVYLVPDVEGSGIVVYSGPNGDPDQDEPIGRIHMGRII